MKTTNNAQKTENTQVRTVVLRGAAVIFSIVLLSWTVTAQDFWKELLTNNTYGKMAMLMVSQPSESSKVDDLFEAVEADLKANVSFTAEVTAAETEQSLEIESWMTNENLFNAKTDFLTTEAEKELVVEGWMTESKYFTSNAFEANVDAEPALEIEGWMLQDEYFVPAELTVENEQELQIESWMLDTQNFEKSEESLELEAWMTDNNFWGF
ncbi:MAG: hypothetical protein JNK09_09655 [Prolixibacteraceae bacterium]|nr:hypothetical protein [Prolixibacteraceae bacterium]